MVTFVMGGLGPIFAGDGPDPEAFRRAIEQSTGAPARILGMVRVSMAGVCERFSGERWGSTNRFVSSPALLEWIAKKGREAG